jgi:hypothetical protein
MNENTLKLPHKKIWTNVEKTQFYLICDSEKLAEGEFLIRTATGLQQLISLDSIQVFEVDKNSADDWLKAQLKLVLSQLKFSNKGDASQKSDKKTKEEKSKTLGLDLLAKMTDTPREELDNNYAAVGRTLGDYLTQTAQTVGEALSDDKLLQQKADKKLSQWEEILKEQSSTT